VLLVEMLLVLHLEAMHLHLVPEVMRLLLVVMLPLPAAMHLLLAVMLVAHLLVARAPAAMLQARAREERARRAKEERMARVRDPRRTERDPRRTERDPRRMERDPRRTPRTERDPRTARATARMRKETVTELALTANVRERTKARMPRRRQQREEREERLQAALVPLTADLLRLRTWEDVCSARLPSSLLVPPPTTRLLVARAPLRFQCAQDLLLQNAPLLRNAPLLPRDALLLLGRQQDVLLLRDPQQDALPHLVRRTAHLSVAVANNKT